MTLLRLRPHFAACHRAGYEPHLLRLPLYDVVSVSSCFSSFVAISVILYSSVSLLALSLQLLFQVCVFFSTLSLTHPSQGRSLSICPGRSSFSTYHVSFDQLPPRPTTASGFWVWDSNPFLTIRYAFRSWHVFNIAPFFLTFDTGSLLAREKEEDLDTRCIVLE